jgi:very-short-patch-repair endonuclease
MRWVCTKEEAEYMRVNQSNNLAKSKTNKAENWMKAKLDKTGHKWTRQAMWGYRLFDFWCHNLGIAVEVDGANHNNDYDSVRDKYNYCRSAIIVIRVRNMNEYDADNAIKTIMESETWKERKAKVRPGKKLVISNGMKMAKSAHDKMFPSKPRT